MAGVRGYLNLFVHKITITALFTQNLYFFNAVRVP
jgi:hypothetical protein